MAETWQEFRVSNDCITDVEELRRRLDDEGYLFFKKLQNRDKLLALRRDMTAALRAGGWLVPDADPMLGIADTERRTTEGDLEYNKVYFQIQRLESFHRIPHEPELMSVVERILGKKAIPLPGKKARIWFPRFKEHTTPLHQDFVHYQGSTGTLTCWAPVGDCPIELGPLAVLPGSHKVRKVLAHHFSLGAGGLIIDLKQETKRYPVLDTRWLSTNFELGDTLFFPALTVHKALPNNTDNRMRISLDNRYEAVGNRIAEHMLVPHMTDVSPLSWEEIYKDWKSDELKYYWTKVDFQKIPRYWGYARKGFAEALELARNRDKSGILALHRAIRSNPSSEDAAKARAVLREIGEPETTLSD
jgi:ectoine hydroxylase-related dioxygenase (phytanoyl-CoA dioxygenase family)